MENNTLNLNNKQNKKLGKNATSPISQGKLLSKVNELTGIPLKSAPAISQINKAEYEKNSTLSNISIIEHLVNGSNIDNSTDYCNYVFSAITKNINSAFYAIGIFKERSSCINLKLNDKSGNHYSSKIFLKNDSNPIIKAFNTKKIQFLENSDYLNLSYFKNYATAIIPLISLNKCIGVFIIEDSYAKHNALIYQLIANQLAMVIHNIELLEKSEAYTNTDSLTLLYNHRGFQELLTNEIQRAQINKQVLSIVLMDINNITKINRELGHAKGDEIIKLVAEKVRQNVREGDIAARYGGDEIAIILPNTTSEQAKYLAEYFTYSLSCCFVDDIGPIKVSVGIATYPNCADDKEKLLILAEQAMYISLAKGYKDGMTAIISSQDFNFWDDIALKSYAEVVSKRHAQLGINFEEELLNKFSKEHDATGSKIWEIATSLAGAIDAKDPYTKGHSTSVSKYSEALARAINLPETEIDRITLGALLHDVGKIGIPETILKKEGPLSDEEWNTMKQHPVIGVEKVLQQNPTLKDLIPIVKHHHERIDGKGYPSMLAGDEIPLAARIVAIADTYHALISDRPYRKGMDIQKAISILEDGAGKQWDADLVRTFVQIAPSLGV